MTLLEHLPPVGWGDVVTKEYVDQRLDVLEHRLTSAIDNKLRAQFIAIVTANTAIVGLLLTILKFAK